MAYISKERDRQRQSERVQMWCGGRICVSVCLCMCCRGLGCVGGIKSVV